VASVLDDLARYAEAEPLLHEALKRREGKLAPNDPKIATVLNNLASLLWVTNRLAEAEPLMRRALALDEAAYGPEHPKVARDLNNLAQLLKTTNRLAEAEPLSRRSAGILLDFTRRTRHEHPHLRKVLANYTGTLEALGRSRPKIQAQLRALQAKYGVKVE
jgi:hypothetical protein